MGLIRETDFGTPPRAGEATVSLVIDGQRVRIRGPYISRIGRIRSGLDTAQCALDSSRMTARTRCADLLQHGGRTRHRRAVEAVARACIGNAPIVILLEMRTQPSEAQHAYEEPLLCTLCVTSRILASLSASMGLPTGVMMKEGRPVRPPLVLLLAVRDLLRAERQ